MLEMSDVSGCMTTGLQVSRLATVKANWHAETSLPLLVGKSSLVAWTMASEHRLRAWQDSVWGSQAPGEGSV